jgi:hypothetical protein
MHVNEILFALAPTASATLTMLPATSHAADDTCSVGQPLTFTHTGSTKH